MIENVPDWIHWAFLLITLLTLVIFHFSNGKSMKLTVLIIIWSLIHSILASNGFYEQSDRFPPRFLLVLIPVLVFIIFGLTKKRRNWILKNRRTELSTYLHTIRLPVEIILFYLFTYKMLPELMTFEGRNFDILAGISAPIIGILWLKRKISASTLIIWNIVGLFLILFVFINGILSSELPIQMFAFEQPTIAINYFPYVLLPATVVPIVIYTHITDIIKLWKEKSAYKTP